MTSKLVHFSMVALCAISLTALAQSSSSAAGLPAAPGSETATTPAPPAGTKIATINIEQAISATNEGQRDLEALYKKLEPKQTELKSSSDELESLKKQLSAQGDKLNDEARGNLVRQIDMKQKAFDRSMQDARDDANSQQQEIMQKLLQKLAPVLQKYVAENGYGLLLDMSKPWPDGPVVMSGVAFDITKPVVEAYNAQSGVSAPAPAAAKPAAARPSGTSRPTTPTK